MSNEHKIGDLVWDAVECELGILVKIWTKKELKEAKEDYLEYIYEICFIESGSRDRYREIDGMKENLVEVLLNGRPQDR